METEQILRGLVRRPDTLKSGWAWSQLCLDGATAVPDSKVVEGSVPLMDPEVTFLGELHARFKFLFSGLYAKGAARTARLPQTVTPSNHRANIRTRVELRFATRQASGRNSFLHRKT